MKSKTSCLIAACFPVIFLSACGGAAGLDFDIGGDDDESSSGGSSTEGPISTTPAQKIDLPQDGTATLNGRAVVQSFSTNQSSGQVSVLNQTGPTTSDLVLTTSGGNIIAVSGNAGGSVVNLDSRTGDNLSQGTATVTLNSPGLNSGATIVDPTRSRFEYQTFGAWLQNRNQPSGTAAAGSYGSVTPTADMPSGRTANYQGASTGIARRADGTQYQTTSLVSVTTDFSTATISSTDTFADSLLLGGSDGLAPELDFSGSGNVSNSGFTANISGSGTSGQAYGVFYGPDAEEVGGTFQTSGPGGVSYIGAFGAN